jgi:hypothetical protein
MAMHSDSVEYGNDWIRVDFVNDRSTTYGVEDPRDPGYLIYGTGTYGTTLVNGGRKTNGTAVTAPIEVLYDGPREFIAVCRTTIYDHLISATVSNSTVSDIALLQIAITIRFDKVKKNVVLLKDVKSLLVEKEGLHMKVQFSNRGEVDLGTATVGVSSYGHFYTQGTALNDTLPEGKPTVYNSSWQIIQTENSSDTAYPGYTAAATSYPQSSGATYDLAQAINPLAGYVWSAAFWPSLSDWSIDGWEQWWHSLTANDPHYIDAAVEEPFIPFYIGEWDFVLYHTLDNAGRTQFRGVTQYSVTEDHDGSDANKVIDSEVMYYLNETFNPWNLNHAVHKDTLRWLEWKTTTATTFTTKWSPVYLVSNSEWDDYCVFSERVINMATGKLLTRGVNYTVTLNPAGTATFTGLPTAVCKILYSTWDDGRYEWVEVGRNAATVDSAGSALIAEAYDSFKDIRIGIAGADMDTIGVADSMPWVMANFSLGTSLSNYKDALLRAALRDDFCKTWPVASSNMIGTGGPLANLLAYYANDFTDAFYGQSPFAGTAYSGKITGIPCWNRNWDGAGYNVYNSSVSTGYAVITTYKDINGTVLFLVWGHWGRDTYYAAQWLHGDDARSISPGIEQLQDAPGGLTSIILKISYLDPTHPTFSIVEALGTISETLWTHNSELKGGIHDP